MAVVDVQEYLTKDLLEDVQEENSENHTLELLHFTRNNGVPLTDEQVKGMFLLNEYGLGDLANFAQNLRPMTTPTKKYFSLINKLTMADRIKGNVNLNKLMKNQVPDPNAHVPKGDIQARSLRHDQPR